MTAPRWNEVTAVFGGTFDPPHLGHRKAVQGLLELPGVRQIKIIPSASPPHKPSAATTRQRVRMTEMTFQEMPGVELDLREIAKSERSPGLPTYTFDTLTEIRLEIPKLAFVVGADQLALLHTWHRFPDLLKLCHWLVLSRKPDGEAVASKTISHWEASNLLIRERNTNWKIQGSPFTLSLFPTEAPDLSSSWIRRQIGIHGELPENCIIPAVSEYLKENRLYGTT